MQVSKFPACTICIKDGSGNSVDSDCWCYHYWFALSHSHCVVSKLPWTALRSRSRPRRCLQDQGQDQDTEVQDQGTKKLASRQGTASRHHRGKALPRGVTSLAIGWNLVVTYSRITCHIGPTCHYYFWDIWKTCSMCMHVCLCNVHTCVNVHVRHFTEPHGFDCIAFE